MAIQKDEREHIRFAVLAADAAVFTIRGEELLVRLIKVDRPPYFKNAKGLPGGLLHPDETARQAAGRHISTKAGIALEKIHQEQFYTFSRVDRDPRGRVVAVAYLALVPWEDLSDVERADSEDTWWCPVSKAKKLAYDHDRMLSMAVDRLRTRVRYSTLLSRLMPREFTLTQLEKAYATVLGTQLDKRNFRKKILKLDIVTPIKGKRTRDTFRPAQIYRFKHKEVVEAGVI